MDNEKSIEVTDAMLQAGAEVLSQWKYETDFVGERQAAKEIFRAMFAVYQRQQRNPITPR